MLNFGFKAEKDLALRLSEHIKKTLPAKMMQQNKGMLSANRVTRTLEQCYVLAKDAHASRKVSYLGRVLMANHLRWELLDMGYPKNFVDLTVEGLIVELSKKTVSCA